VRAEVGKVPKERAPNNFSKFWRRLMLDTSLIQGLEIVLIVSLMSVIVSPILCWILPNRFNVSEAEKTV
jgi:hypothetical protein